MIAPESKAKGGPRRFNGGNTPANVRFHRSLPRGSSSEASLDRALSIDKEVRAYVRRLTLRVSSDGLAKAI